MRILLIEPSYYTNDGLTKGPLYRNVMRGSFHLSLTLPHLAALAPPDVETTLAFDVCEDLEAKYDLKAYDIVGITCHTTHVRRTLDLARMIRRLGRPVVIGGPATIEDDHRLVPVLGRFATSVVVGEAEQLWPQVIADIRAGCPRPVYRNVGPVPLAGLPVPRFDLINWDYFTRPIVLPAMASRGCPRDCTFCSEFLYGSWRLRPAQEVADELAAYEQRFGVSRVAFRDDDFLVNTRFARDLLERIRPLGVEWSCQTDLNLARHLDMARLAVDAGLRSVSFGLESIKEANLAVARKRFFTIPEAEALLHFLHEAGVETQVNIIFGFDGDDPEVFDATVDFVLRNRVSLFFPSILYPIPGTPIYEQLRREGRLFQLHPPGIEDPLLVNYVPKRMAAEQLVQGYRHARDRFYRERKDPVFWLDEELNIWGTTPPAPATC